MKKIKIARKYIKRFLKIFFVISLAVSWLLASWPPIWLNPRFPKEIESVKAVIPSGVIVGWPSTAGTIPAGWNRVTALDANYPKGTATATDPGGTGGNLTHSHTTQSHTHTANHTHTVPNSTAASGSTSRDPGATHAPNAHTHDSNPSTSNPTASIAGDTPSTDSVNNEPAYFTIIFIQSDGVTPTGIPNNAITLWNDTGSTPTSWNLADGGSGRPDLRNRFMKGAAASGDGGGTGGASTHTHTIASHTHGTDFSHDHPTVTSSAPTQAAICAAGSGGQAATATSGHTHTLTIGTQATDAITGNTDTAQSGNNEPPYVAEAFIQNNKGSEDLPVGIIALWTGLLTNIPSGWVLADGGSGTPDLRSTYVKGANTLGGIGGTGGSLTHNHTATGHTHSVASHSHTVSAGTGAGSNINAGSTVCSTTAHTHPSWSNTGASSFTSGTGTPTVDNYTDTQPPYYTVAYIQYQGANPALTQDDFRWYEDETTLTLTNLWGSVITGDNQDIAAIPVAHNPPTTGSKLRLQINVSVADADLGAAAQDFILQYKAGTDQDCSTGSWTQVGAQGASGVAWRFFDNTSLTDGATQVNQISTSTAGAEGRYLESISASWTNPNAVNTGQKMEWDFAIEPGPTVANATTYAFRLIKGTNGYTVAYTAGDCPTLETAPGADNLMRHGNFFLDGSEKGFFWAE